MNENVIEIGRYTRMRLNAIMGPKDTYETLIIRLLQPRKVRCPHCNGKYFLQEYGGCRND